MAETMQFDLVSPERSLASFAASEVQVPGSEGEMTVMPEHAPVITTLRPGIVRARGEKGDEEFIVTQGIAEISAASVAIIAEQAFPRAEVSRADMEKILEEARARAEAASGEERLTAEKFVEELVHFIEMME